MACSNRISVRKGALLALTMALATGVAKAQNYQSLGSYEDWATQSGVQVAPPAPAPNYTPPRTEYFGDGRDDTILYDPTGRIIGTRDAYGRTQYTSPPIPEPGNDDYDFQRDGRGQDGWREQGAYRGVDITGFDQDGNPMRSYSNPNQSTVYEPRNDGYDARRDGRGRDDRYEDQTYTEDDNTGGYNRGHDFTPEPGLE